eukprot:CAMPEP_0201595236 /NCGR_PEP_ID=MMETSP0190_2-20130828/192299_1 /ASSEMBLY_ACC=CAM_ASM_000263 /TAXON_ID=37353 /ORGANISM="Rosalina sp." /LENGTH=61 /DNA_ID=CAMNT_0048055145 /DNA_START=1645 /DNA_END=1830 /DNA_ORIENTATION=+
MNNIQTTQDTDIIIDVNTEEEDINIELEPLINDVLSSSSSSEESFDIDFEQKVDMTDDVPD